MDITVAVGALTWYPVRTTLEHAREAGAAGAELLLTPTMLRRGPEHYARVSAMEGLPIRSVHALLSFLPERFERKVRDDRASVRFAAALDDCDTVVLHPPLTGPGMAAELIAWLDAICMERDAVRPDLQLAIENRSLNHDGTPVQLLDNLDMLRSVAGEWALGITLDLAHAASHGIDLDGAITAVLPNLVNVHISDAHPRATRGGVRSGLLRDHQIPGTGCLPLRDAIDQLTVGSYGGPLTLELSPLSLRAYNPREARRRLAESVATLRSMIAPVSHDTQVASAVRGAAG